MPQPFAAKGNMMPRRITEPTDRWRRAFMALGMVVVFLAITSDASMAQTFPSPATPRLAADFSVVVTGQSLRDLVNSMQQATRLPILMDRRVDPSAAAIPATDPPSVDPLVESPVVPKTLGPNLAGAIDGLTDLRGLEWASCGDFVWIGPRGHATAAATEILVANQKVQRAAAFDRRPIKWPILTTPNEALRMVADTWRLDASDIDLPHDLWPATDLGETQVTTALGAISSHFDLHFELDPATRKLSVRPIDPAVRFVHRYPALPLTPVQRREITRDDRIQGGPAAVLKQQRDNWLLTGDAAAHLRTELAIFKRGSQNANPATSEVRYTFKFQGFLGDAIQNLCQAGNLRTDLSGLPRERLMQRIELEAKDQTIEDLLRQVGRLGSLEVQIEGGVVVVRAD
jgi:hypothetical protein